MITKDSLLPEVIARYPGTRRVLDAYGLSGCGGPTGPSETVEFFARVHGVPLEKLLAELERAKDAPARPYVERLEDRLYRRFFRGGIAVLLTAGATMGAVLLVFYALRKSFTSLDLFGYVQAHGNAQIYGWLGLFVMGFAYQGFPRFKYVQLWKPEWAARSFVLMAAGVAVRAAAALPVPGALALGVAGSLLESLAVAIFVGILLRTLRASPMRDAWDRYVLASLAFFLLTALAEPGVYAFIFTAPDPEALVRRVADVMKPFRDLELLGFAGLMVLGVSQRILPTAFGFRAVGRARSSAAFALLLSGLAVDVVAWGIFRRTGRPVWAVLSWAGAVMYAAGAIVLALGLRAWTGGAREDRSTKFIRAAYGWLAVACGMVWAEPLYAFLSGLRFSHAYHGAIRHAFTVGFLSLMIVGVSSKVVPILQGLDLKGLPALAGAFFLINSGNALRVASQVATDWIPAWAFPPMGASGVLEVLGFSLWGAHLWRLLGAGSPPASAPGALGPDTRVAEIAEAHPESLEVFERFGFRELRNPVLRRTLARRVTVRMACQMKGVPEEEFLAALRGVCAKAAFSEARAGVEGETGRTGPSTRAAGP